MLHFIQRNLYCWLFIQKTLKQNIIKCINLGMSLLLTLNKKILFIFWICIGIFDGTYISPKLVAFANVIFQRNSVFHSETFIFFCKCFKQVRIVFEFREVDTLHQCRYLSLMYFYSQKMQLYNFFLLQNKIKNYGNMITSVFSYLISFYG